MVLGCWCWRCWVLGCWTCEVLRVLEVPVGRRSCGPEGGNCYDSGTSARGWPRLVRGVGAGRISLVENPDDRALVGFVGADDTSAGKHPAREASENAHQRLLTRTIRSSFIFVHFSARFSARSKMSYLMASPPRRRAAAP